MGVVGMEIGAMFVLMAEMLVGVDGPVARGFGVPFPASIKKSCEGARGATGRSCRIPMDWLCAGTNG